jgi:hypothetical protein
MQKYKDNSLFDFIDYVLKNNNNELKDYKPPIFLVNRWLSMANPAFARIINLTTNKWCNEISNFDISKLYRIILPKYGKRISYIKKENNKEKDYDEDLNTAFIMECSQREINSFKDTLAELNISAK